MLRPLEAERGFSHPKSTYQQEGSRRQLRLPFVCSPALSGILYIHFSFGQVPEAGN
jgi:hypothetical protein